MVYSLILKLVPMQLNLSRARGMPGPVDTVLSPFFGTSTVTLMMTSGTFLTSTLLGPTFSTVTLADSILFV